MKVKSTTNSRAKTRAMLSRGSQEFGPVNTCAIFSKRNLRNAILAACDRYEKAQEFRAQHGPVRQIMKDGKLCE